MLSAALSRLRHRVGVPLARRAPLAAVGRAMRRDVVAFLWHTASDEPLPHVGPLYAFKSPAELGRDLDWVTRHFRVVSDDDVREGRAGGRALPRRAALLTFDDGMRECLTVARAMLLERGLPCTFFVTSEFLDNRRLFYRHKAALAVDAARRLAPGERGGALARLGAVAGAPLATVEAAERWVLARGAAEEGAIDDACAALGVDAGEFLRRRRPYLTSGEVRSLAADGFAIGGHGRAHVRLGSLGSASAVEEEIVASCRVAAGLAGRDRAPFAFPFHGVDVGRDLLGAIRAAHPVVGTLFDTGGVSRDRDFVVPRICVARPPRPGEATTLPRELRAAYVRAAEG